MGNKKDVTAQKEHRQQPSSSTAVAGPAAASTSTSAAPVAARALNKKQKRRLKAQEANLAAQQARQRQQQQQQHSEQAPESVQQGPAQQLDDLSPAADSPALTDPVTPDSRLFLDGASPGSGPYQPVQRRKTDLPLPDPSPARRSLGPQLHSRSGSWTAEITPALAVHQHLQVDDNT